MLLTKFDPMRDFRDLETEIQCFALAENAEKCACIFNEKVCSIKTESECIQSNGEFHKDYLWSHPDLNTSCEKQADVSCVEGKEELFLSRKSMMTCIRLLLPLAQGARIQR